MTETLESLVLKHKEQVEYSTNSTLYFHQGHKYVGPFNNNCMEGEGEFIWKDGTVYVGSFHKNTLSGEGSYTWKDKSYKGNVFDGKRHGNGCMKVGNTRYKGEWKEGKLHGKGILTYADESVYNGEWHENKRHGFGTFLYKNCDEYCGEWKFNNREGNGTMEWKSRNERYVGEWKAGKPHGKGKLEWGLQGTLFNNFYEGEWKDGKRHGHGTFRYANGANYVGEWKENKKHGHGIYSSENGRRYEGAFVYDRMAESSEMFNNTLPYKFNLKSILEWKPNPVAMWRNYAEIETQINVLVSRHAVELKEVYQTLVGLDASAKVLKKRNLNLFLGEFILVRHSTTLLAVNRLVALQFRNDKIFSNRFNNPHYEGLDIIFIDFLSILIATAVYVYNEIDLSNVPIVIIEQSKEALAFSTFLTEDLFRGIKSLKNRLKTELGKLYFECFALFYDKLCMFYNKIAKRASHDFIYTKGLADATGDKTMDLRQLLVSLVDITSYNPTEIGNVFKCIFGENVSYEQEVSLGDVFGVMYKFAELKCADVADIPSFLQQNLQ